MNPAQLFAAFHLAGTCLGIVSGDLLPFWLSGVAGWSLGISAACFGYACGENMRPARWTRSVAAGLFFGALSGAAAADFAEVADALTWPGHDSAAAVSAALGVSFCWAFAAVAMPLRRDPFRPTRVGLWLYVIALAVAYSPLLKEVL